MHTKPLSRAAWAPWGDREWLIRRSALAAEWLVRAAQEEGASVVVQGVSGAGDYRRLEGPVGQLARMGKVATYRTRVGPGATYVHHATTRLLATAMRTANGHSVAATEIPTMPLHGWAMALGAFNVRTGEPTLDTRTAEQVRLLELFVDQLYNGWSHKQVGQRASAYYLPKLVEEGMTYSVFVGSLIAIGAGHLGHNSDIEAMRKALPPAWAEEREALTNVCD